MPGSSSSTAVEAKWCALYLTHQHRSRQLQQHATSHAMGERASTSARRHAPSLVRSWLVIALAAASTTVDAPPAHCHRRLLRTPHRGLPHSRQHVMFPALAQHAVLSTHTLAINYKRTSAAIAAAAAWRHLKGHSHRLIRHLCQPAQHPPHAARHAMAAHAWPSASPTARTLHSRRGHVTAVAAASRATYSLQARRPHRRRCHPFLPLPHCQRLVLRLALVQHAQTSRPTVA